MIPWPGKEQCVRLSEESTGRSECPELMIDEEANEVVCASVLGVRNVPGAYSHRCGRGRIYSRYRGRCVYTFF